MPFFGNLARRLKARRERWDSLCKRCGICCYAKESRLFHTIIFISKPCEYYDRRSRLCKIYDRRFAICHYCGKVRLYHALLSRSLPDTCGYVERYRRWRIVRGAEIVKD